MSPIQPGDCRGGYSYSSLTRPLCSHPLFMSVFLLPASSPGPLVLPSPPPTLYHTWTSRKNGYSLNIRGIGCVLMREAREEGSGVKGIKYRAPIWGVQLMNHPGQREQKRDDPDSFVCLPPIPFLFFTLSRNSFKNNYSYILHTLPLSHT